MRSEGGRDPPDMKEKVTIRNNNRWRRSIGAGLALVLASGLMIPGCGGQRVSALRTRSASQEKSGAGSQHPVAEQVNARQSLGAHAQATTLEFKTQPKQVAAGQPAIWMLKVFDVASGDDVRTFQIVRDKFMHLIVVSRDLRWFAHVYPEYKDHGLFITRMILPRAGVYKLYADYTPRDGKREVVQRELKAAVGRNDGLVTLARQTPSPPADKPGRNGWITKRAVVAPEGEAGESVSPDGSSYEVALMPTPAKLRVNQDAILHFQVRDADGEIVNNLQPWLGVMGYAVIVSADSDVFLPAQPQDGSAKTEMGGADVAFRTRFPAPGSYKVWAEFKHNDSIITAAFVLEIAAKAPAR
jgi:hypothetical protein